MVPEPYYNEPGYATSQNNKYHQQASKKYTLNIRRYTIEYAMIEHIEDILKNGHSTLYAEFTEVLARHFVLRADAIRSQVEHWVAEDKTLQPLAKKLNACLTKLQDVYPSTNGQHAAATTTTEGDDQVIELDGDEKPPAAASVTAANTMEGTSDEPIVL